MKKLIFSAVVTALLVSQVSFAANGSCEGLASLKLPDTTITLAQSVATGKLAPGGGGGRGSGSQSGDLPSFCRIAATLKPSTDSEVKIEVWLPTSNWNGKFEAVGNRGWNGNIVADALAAGVRRGYAVASTE